MNDLILLLISPKGDTMRTTKLASVAAVLGLALVGVAAAPHDALAWWRGGYGLGVYGPPVIVAPPPVVYPPPVYIAPPPVAYLPPPRRIWIPPHWEGPYWVPGHWA
jgi:hypothetical protein